MWKVLKYMSLFNLAVFSETDPVVQWRRGEIPSLERQGGAGCINTIVGVGKQTVFLRDLFKSWDSVSLAVRSSEAKMLEWLYHITQLDQWRHILPPNHSAVSLRCASLSVFWTKLKVVSMHRVWSRLPLSGFTLYLRQSLSFSECRSSCFYYVHGCCPAGSGDLPASASAVGVRDVTAWLAFMWVPGSWAQVFMSLQWTVYLLSNPPHLWPEGSDGETLQSSWLLDVWNMTVSLL